MSKLTIYDHMLVDQFFFDKMHQDEVNSFIKRIEVDSDLNELLCAHQVIQDFIENRDAV